ncbi:MAG: choice-of-anchor Q domain-containing protein [Methylococcales bacterium]
MAEKLLIYKSDHIDVINNTTYQNSQTNSSISEITLGKADDVNLYNNIVYPELDDHAINMWATGSSITIDYNLIYNTDKNFFPHANNLIESDPLFVNIDPKSGQYDFRLKADSPAIDNGNNQFASIIDSDGITRPVNTEYDIGAFEFTGQNAETSKNTQQDQSKNTKTTTKTVSLAIKISTSNDDVEEKASGKVIKGSGDLDLVRSGGNQTIGMRFTTVSIPKGAVITNAYIQFTAKSAGSKKTKLVIKGKAEDDASVFNRVAFNVSSAPTTSSIVSWSPRAWSKRNEYGLKQRTPNLASIIQEIIDRPGWSQDNALALIISGRGKREAVSYDGNPDAAPRLFIKYVTN